MRRDYDEPEAAMVKPVVPSPGLEMGKALDYDAPEAIPSTPGGCGCGHAEQQPIPAKGKLILICPVCEGSNPYEPAMDVTPDASVSCPRCASSVPLKSFYKGKEGSYVSKTASSMDALFKKIYEIIPKDEQVTLSKGKVNQLHSIIQRFRKFYEKVHCV
jgi:hypothetical protein